MQRSDSNQIKRRHRGEHTSSSSSSSKPNEETSSVTSNASCIDLTLTEELFLLALDDGKTNIWNDSLSMALRGSILVELEMLDRIKLEPRTLRKKSIVQRKIQVKNHAITGERLVDEALKHIQDYAEGATVGMWLEFLSGENWNPYCNWQYQLRNVKDRLAKDLVEKGVLTTKKQNYFIFESTSFPFQDDSIKKTIAHKIQHGMLDGWKGKANLLDFNLLSLILLTFAAELWEEVLEDIDYSTYQLAKQRLSKMVNTNFEKQAEESPNSEIAWAVFKTLLK